MPKSKTPPVYPTPSPALERGTVAIPRPANELDGRSAADGDPGQRVPRDSKS